MCWRSDQKKKKRGVETFVSGMWAQEALVFGLQEANLAGWHQEDFRQASRLWVHEKISKSSLGPAQCTDVCTTLLRILRVPELPPCLQGWCYTNPRKQARWNTQQSQLWVEKGGPDRQGPLWLYNVFEAKSGYMRPCLNATQNQRKSTK